jgi:hypothetical protein
MDATLAGSDLSICGSFFVKLLGLFEGQILGNDNSG